VDALVDELIMVHAASLPLPSCFTYSNAPLEIARHCLQMAEQPAFLGTNQRDKPLVISTAAASPVWRQRREWSDIATASLRRNRSTRATPGVWRRRWRLA
jgi:hypothetical protein